MDELIEAPAKPKRITWANRMRKKVAYLSGDIAALERLVGTLLHHLERATQPDITDQERNHFRAMVDDIRAALAEGEREGGPPTVDEAVSCDRRSDPANGTRLARAT